MHAVSASCSKFFKYVAIQTVTLNCLSSSDASLISYLYLKDFLGTHACLLFFFLAVSYGEKLVLYSFYMLESF